MCDFCDYGKVVAARSQQWAMKQMLMSVAAMHLADDETTIRVTVGDKDPRPVQVDFMSEGRPGEFRTITMHVPKEVEPIDAGHVLEDALVFQEGVLAEKGHDA